MVFPRPGSRLRFPPLIGKLLIGCLAEKMACLPPLLPNLGSGAKEGGEGELSEPGSKSGPGGNGRPFASLGLTGTSTWGIQMQVWI
jgi:hypothetical protein